MELGKSLPHETHMWVHILPQPDMYLLFIYLLIDLCLFYFYLHCMYIHNIYTHFECSLLDLGVGFGRGQTFSNFPCTWPPYPISALFSDACI